MAEPADLLPALRAYLDDDVTSQWTDTELEGAIAAEISAQLGKCRQPRDVAGVALSPAAYPADLLEALLRRCARNLAMRKLPLGISYSGEAETTRIGSNDPEIRRLEAPWRRLVVG